MIKTQFGTLNQQNSITLFLTNPHPHIWGHTVDSQKMTVSFVPQSAPAVVCLVPEGDAVAIRRRQTFLNSKSVPFAPYTFCPNPLPQSVPICGPIYDSTP